MIVSQKYRTYRFGSPQGLSSSQMDLLIDCFLKSGEKSEGLLSGRSPMLTKKLPGAGRVVIKSYLRGGMLRHVNRRTYLGLGLPRSQAEFERLQFVRRIGIKAPPPVAFAVKGHFLYHAWLITGELSGARSLSTISMSAPDKIDCLMPQVIKQIQCLIRNQVLHVDLHPGNVLVDSKDRVFLIDFDKARISLQSPERLTRHYRRRWHRAIVKYRLSRNLDEAFQGIRIPAQIGDKNGRT